MSKITINNQARKEELKATLVILKDLLKECKDEHVQIWLRDRINEILIEII
jgi:hypothetical protein